MRRLGDAGERLDLVREATGSTVQADLYQAEWQKVTCGGRDFGGALGVGFKLVADARALPGGVAVGGSVIGGLAGIGRIPG